MAIAPSADRVKAVWFEELGRGPGEWGGLQNVRCDRLQGNPHVPIRARVRKGLRVAPPELPRLETGIDAPRATGGEGPPGKPPDAVDQEAHVAFRGHCRPIRIDFLWAARGDVDLSIPLQPNAAVSGTSPRGTLLSRNSQWTDAFGSNTRPNRMFCIPV